MATAADTEVAADDVNMTSSSTDVSGVQDDLVGASTRKLRVAVADAVSDVDLQNNNSVQQAPALSGGTCQVSSVTSVAGLLSRRRTPTTPTDSGPTVVSLHDVRKFVFQTPARSDKRIMAGLRAHTFTSQTFVSSFAVGLAIGSILAIIIKLLTELGYRVLPYHH